MRHRVTPWVLVVLLLAAGTAAAQVQSITLKGGSSAMAVTDQSVAAASFRVEVRELQTMQVATKEGVFTRLMIPGFHGSQREGAPELPMMNRLLAIPAGATARVEVKSVRSRDIDLAAYGITTPLMPFQPSVSKSADPAALPFVWDRAAYAADKVAQDLVKVVAVGRLRAMDMGRLEVSPVEYFPAANRVRVHEEIEFTVVFDGADKAATGDLIARTHSPYFEVVYGQVANTKGFHDSYPDRVRDVVTMVIVTPPQFEAQLQNFVDWKTRRGFHVVVGVTGTPAVGTTTTSIKAYLANLYNNATPELPAPSFVLFVGDVEQLPTFFEGGDATDRPYCCIDADLMPDMYYGRFSATNSTQLQAQLDKTLMYDQFTMPDPSYLGRVVMIAGVDGTYGPVWANGQINYGTTYYFNAAHGITSNTYLYPASGSSDAQIVANASEGRGYINYTAHGSETSWADPTFTQANVNGLANAGKYGLVVGNCCLTSTYDTAECFGETWLRAANKGAIGYIGGSNSTYWDEDYWWGVGYRASVVLNPTYDANALGGYDGLFHDHGENMNLWYVTSDALVFCGNLAVTQSGSSRITYYWNIYNLLGDPSLTPYLGVPSANPVSHPATVFTTWTSLDVSAEPNSYVGLTQNGVLVGAGTTDAAGDATITFLQTPLTPGVPLHMVVMAQNRVPYAVDINVIVPAVVTFDPASIAANTPTPVTVTVYDADGTTPQPGVDIWAAGLDYVTTPVSTDASGQAVITIDYPYGPSIDVVGRRTADPYELFRLPLPVTALPLTAPDLAVTTAIGLADTFALNLPGTLVATVTEPGHVLHAILPDGTDLTTGGASLPLTPAQAGVVTGIIAVDGYDLYTETFPIVEAYGTLAGTVTAAGGGALAGATVRGYDALDSEVFAATTNAAGVWAAPEELLCATYTVRASLFGYLTAETPYFVNYGANTLDFALAAAPAGVLTGTVADAVTMEPLAATVRVYRSDTMALYTETTSDAGTGAFTTSSLPYFDYVVRVRASHHVPVVITITINEPTVEKGFLLEPTAGDILVIDDDAVAVKVEDKLDEKTGALLEAGYDAAEGKAATDLVAALEDLGYFVALEPGASTDPADWENYDLIVLACGANTASLAPAGLKTALAAYVNAGGHILVEGGEVGYTHYTDAAFAPIVLRSNDWNHDSSGNVTVHAPTHPVMSVPNVITGPITMSYAAYGDQDAMVPTNGGVMVASWSTYPTDASIIVYDPNPAPSGGQIVYFAFNYTAMDAAVRPLLLENAVTYLLASEIGNCGVTGRVTMHGWYGDLSGITVTATPNGGTTTTAADGSYAITGLYAGTYTVTASKTGWSTAVTPCTLGDGQVMTDVDLEISRVTTTQACRTHAPVLAIPDNNPTGVYSAQTMSVNGAVSGVQVSVNITHTWIGDLIVKLRAPSGTEVVLHNRTGSSADNIVGTYPTTLTPAQSLDALIGEEMSGEWRLIVSDNAGSDLGSLSQWCLMIAHPDLTTGVGDQAPVREVVLSAAWPNPFNPQTKIAFALPRTLVVDLAIYDVSGRRVATLAAGELPAGPHEATWTGRDDSGRAVASGVYFFRLRADGRTLVGKAALLK